MSDKPSVSREECEAILRRGEHPEHETRLTRLARAHMALLDENANLKRDKERLDWYIQIQWVIEMDERGWYLREFDDTVAHEVIIGGFHETPRQSIDAGMAITEEMDRRYQEAIDAARESAALASPSDALAYGEPKRDVDSPVSGADQNIADGVRDDVNLIDVLDFIVDCVMAGMARSGSVYPLELSNELLQRAFQNTVEHLKKNVMVMTSYLPTETDASQGGRD